MPLIYGSGFKPGRIYTGEVKEREKKTESDTALFTFIRVLSAVTFIALSFIPVAGEVGEAALIGAEAAIESGIEGAAEAAIESSVASLESSNAIGMATKIADTARNIRLGDTIKGSVALGLGEATSYEIIDRVEDTQNTFNSIFNFALAFTPVYGALKGRRASNIRLAQTIEKQIEEQNKLLRLSKTVKERSEIEMRIRQLKNTRLQRHNKMFAAPIDSSTVLSARKETMKIVESEAKYSKKQSVQKIASELQNKLRNNEIKLSKTEARQIVRYTTKSIPSVSEGVTIKGIVESRGYNKFVNAMRFLDPNLATRKVFTAAARKLTSNEALLKIETKKGTKEFGQWFKRINLGYYKKFGKKVSKWWRKWGKKIYAHSRVKMIPVISSWIDGYRLVDTPIPGEYIMIVIFKPSKNGAIKPPVIVNPVSLEFAAAFASGGELQSVGAFYIDKIALARNGVGPTITGSLASVLGPLSLGTIRKFLSGPAAMERVIRKVAKGDYIQSWLDNTIETSNRLWSHKIGKIIAGRWGIATARGFQRTSKGHTYFSSHFDARHIIEEMGVVTLDKARAVQRKAGISGRTQIIGARRVVSQWQRTAKLMTFGYAKFDGKQGIKKGKGIF